MAQWDLCLFSVEKMIISSLELRQFRRKWKERDWWRFSWYCADRASRMFCLIQSFPTLIRFSRLNGVLEDSTTIQQSIKASQLLECSEHDEGKCQSAHFRQFIFGNAVELGKTECLRDRLPWAVFHCTVPAVATCRCTMTHADIVMTANKVGAIRCTMAVALVRAIPIGYIWIV